MNARIPGTLIIIVVLFFLACCNSSRKIYQPPALGAEYQFDRGLPRTRHPKQLFGSKMDKYLHAKGMPVPEMGRYSGKPTVATPKTAPGSADSLHRAGSRAGDSLARKTAVPAKTDSLHHVNGPATGSPATSPAHPANPGSPDSSHSVLH